MIAGRLNKRIVIEHYGDYCDNELGEEVGRDLGNITTRADVVWSTGRRVISDMEIDFRYDLTFIVWHYLYSRISEGDIIHYAGKKFGVVSLEPEPETRMLYIRARTL